MQKFKYKEQQRQIYIETLDDLVYYINLFKKVIVTFVCND